MTPHAIPQQEARARQRRADIAEVAATFGLFVLLLGMVWGLLAVGT